MWIGVREGANVINAYEAQAGLCEFIDNSPTCYTYLVTGPVIMLVM